MLTGLLPKLVEYLACKILIMKQISIHIKECILDFLAEIAENMKPILSKNKSLLQKLTEALCIVTMDKQKDEMYLDMPTPSRLALMLFSHLARVLPKKKYYPIMMKAIGTYMKS
jgi:hypothetical protein